MKKKNRLAYFVIIISTIMVIGLSIKGYQVNNLIKRVEEQVEEEKKILLEEQNKLEALEKEVAEINTPEYIERIARNQLKMVREDEIVFKKKQ